MTHTESQTTIPEKYRDHPGVQSVLSDGAWTDPTDRAAAFAGVLARIAKMEGHGAVRELDTMPSATPRNAADDLLCTDLWPDYEAARRAEEALLALCHSSAAAGIFGPGVPAYYLDEMRVGFAPHDEFGEGPHKCGFSGESFDVPTGAPVPALFADSYRGGEIDSEAPVRSWPLHPALIEAGPEFVLWAVWARIEQLAYHAPKNYSIGESLGEAVELLTMVRGAWVENVGTEPPHTAYRTRKKAA